MRSEVRHDSKLFRELSRSLLAKGISITFLVRGRSMFPAILDGEAVQVDPGSARAGDVLLVDTEDGLRVHRLRATDNGRVITQGDACFEPEVSHSSALLGRVSTIWRVDGAGRSHRLARFLSRVRQLISL